MRAPTGTVRDWLDKRAFSDAAAFLFPDGEEALTWGDVQTEASRIAAHVTAQGVAKGESVAVMHPKRTQWRDCTVRLTLRWLSRHHD